jgi:methanethiol S-methyltransferase
MSYIILSILWILYFTLHSVLAADRVKSFFQRVLRKGYRFYRIIYSLISTIGLLALLVVNASISPSILFQRNGVIRYLSLMLATVGIIIISRAFREYRFISFIGLKGEDTEFRRTGILQHVRHPIYSGTILIVLGFFLFNPTLATLISVGFIFAYLPIGIYLEEQKLMKQFGDQYLSYRKEVPSIFPRLIK